MYFNHPEFSDFVAGYEGPGLEHAKRHFACGAPQVEEGPTLAALPKWTSARFPKVLAEQVGSFGWSVPTADLLRRAAKDHNNPEVGSHYEWLADCLGEAGPEPVLADMQPYYRARQLALLELDEAVSQNPDALSGQASGWLRIMVRDAASDVDRGSHHGRLYVGLPADHPAPASDGGDPIQSLAVDVGAEMTAVADEVEASEPNRAAQLRAIVDRWYPDEEAQVDVRTPNEHFCLTALQRADLNEFSAEFLTPIEGSIHIDHYGSNSAYSQDETAYRYRIYGVLEDLEPGEPIQCCLLVCDHHALLAEVYWDEEVGAPLTA